MLTYSPISFALNNPCELILGDADIPKNIEHSIQFIGPQNKFWHYVTDDPSTWTFKIVSSKNSKHKSPSFERIYIKIADSIFVKLAIETDVVHLPENRFTFSPAKIATIVDKTSGALKTLQREKQGSIPNARTQSFTIGFEFKSETYSENWLNQECWVGFGPNSISGRLLSNTDKLIPNFSFSIQVNNPSLSGLHLKDTIPIQTDLNGYFQLDGLPLFATFIADLPTPNKKAAIAYLNEVGQKCDWEIKKESSATAGWTVINNNCSKSGSTHR